MRNDRIVGWVWSVAVAGAIVGGGSALAGPPLITDDPEPVDLGRWEVNIPYTLDLSAKDASGRRAWVQEAPLVDVNYGILKGVHAKFEVPLLVVDEPGEGARAGIGDASLGAKIRLINQDSAPFSMSVFPAVGIPFGDAGRGLGSGSASLLLPVQIGRKFFDDKLFIYGDAGYEEDFARGGVDTWAGGLAMEAQVLDPLTLCAEVRYEYGLRGGGNDALWQVGFKWAMTDSVNLLAAAGRSFDPSPDSGSDLLVYFGVQLEF